jgi:2-keto-3-deoxy-L-rhamnonate aldolase RhmA
MTPVIRVPGTENSAILRSLDTGARGIMVPHVDSADEARMILDSLRYGDSARNRGVATLTRASMFDTRHEREHLASQSELITSIVMIETRDGLEALDEICALPGLDVVFVGIYDLSQSLGMLGGLDHPEFQRLFAETVQRITAHGVAVGCYAATAEAAKRLLDQGVRFVTLCVDGGVLRRAYEGMLDDLGRLTGEAR